MPTQEVVDPVVEQAQKILDLGILKVALSNGFRLIDTQYRSIIEKILNPSELLTEEECQAVTSKEFSKALGSFAQASSKIAQWHRDNNAQDAITFLMPDPVVNQAYSANSVAVELKN